MRDRLALGIILGLVYGVALRLAFGWDIAGKYLSVMLASFLFLAPLVIGFLTTWPLKAPSLSQRLVAPWLPCALLLLISAGLGWEGALCIVMAAPILFLMSSLGGLLGSLPIVKSKRVASCLAVLPFVLAPIESHRPLPQAVQRVKTEIRIQASREEIWKNIESVEEISEHENTPDFFQRIGFPRPVAATLSHRGVGGVRTATFTGGVVFLETITAWEEGHTLSFSIEAQTEQIPATTLDAHLTIGGEFFDVLQGTFAVEVRGEQEAVLHLRSQYRLSTPFNFYAALWSDAVMRSIQENILHVIQTRCERSTPRLAGWSHSPPAHDRVPRRRRRS